MKKPAVNDSSGKPDAGKLARPVWGWGLAVTPALHHTAVWHERQRAIERGEIKAGVFIDELLSYIGGEVARVAAEGLGLNIRKHPCPKCGAAMLRRPGKKGHFWGCSKFPDCTAALPDINCEPGSAGRPDTSIPCPDCGRPMRYVVHSRGDFFGCTGYPGCRKVVRARDGEPNTKKPKPRYGKPKEKTQ